MLCPLSYIPEDGGTRTRNHPRYRRRNPRLRIRPTRNVKEPDNRRGIDGCEATVRTRTSWFRARRGTSSTTSQWSGREGSNLQPPASEAGARPLALRPVSTHGGSRTRTGEALDLVPLPVGLHEQGGPCGSRTRNLLLAGELRYLVAPPAHASRERESNPPREAYETSLIPDLPHCDGVTGRTRTGFLRGHDPACRPLQLRPQSTREESNLRHPPCEGGGLPLTYSSVVGRASWSRTTSSRGISAVPSPSGSRPSCRRRGLFAPSVQSRRRESNPLLLGYGPSVRPVGPRRHGVGGGS